MTDAKDNRIQELRLDPKEREKLIIEHAYLVKRIAYRVSARLPDTVLMDDLISTGTIGLIDALEKYDHTKGKSFKAYAALRINGAILDELRGLDALSRNSRRLANRLNEAIEMLQAETGRRPTDEELAHAMNIGMEELQGIRNTARSLVFLDIDDFAGETLSADLGQAGMGQSGEHDPFRALAEKSMRDRLANAIESLPEQPRLMLSLYYFSELNYKEIGEVLGVSESRISQIHSKAVLQLKKILQAEETVL